MHSNTLITNSNPTTNQNNDNNHTNYSISISNSNSGSISPPENNIHDQIHDDSDHDLIVIDNNPPESSWISHNNVTDWLNHHHTVHTFIERKTSVKMVSSSRKFDSSSDQTRTSQRSVSFNHKPQAATIIGFRQKQPDGKSKQINNDRLFKNRSLPGKSSSGVHVTEPRSPRVSCMGRVGSMRGRARRNGFWKKVKAAILTRVRTNKRGSG
ncbi:hypothetical protein SSX86_007963 [Deinandra increscens subsp. villosa]|uniref:Uncharacterized protein n=1 Tax=Deinandra increscens subsp. villosa TaxID=3103831 RepID=A0AAP0H6D4_9ASTR